MKRVLSLLLALVMCLSLCACGEDVPNSTTTTKNSTDTSGIQTEDDTEKQVKYEHALTLLETSTTDYSDPSALVKEAYDILSELDEYEDAENYLKQIAIIQDVCLFIESFQTNAFGEKTNQYKLPRGYDLESRLSWFIDHKYNPLMGSPEYNTVYVYSYEKNGRVTSRTCKRASNNETMSIMTNQYDENGRIVAETVQSSDGSSVVFTHEYNTVGQCIKSLYDGFYAEFKYDETGRKIEMRKCFDSGYKYVETYYYNDSGDIIQIVGDDIYQDDIVQQQNKLYITEYVYDTGRLVAEKYYSTYNLDNPKDLFDCVEYNYVYGDYYCYTPAG